MKVFWYFLTRYSLRYKWQFAATFGSIAAYDLLMLLTPVLIGIAIDDALDSGLRSRQLVIAGLIVLVSVVRGAFGWTETYLTSWVSERATEHVRNDMARKLLGLSFAYYDRQRTGDLMSRVTYDAWGPLLAISAGGRRVFASALFLVALAVLTVSINWRLALIVFVLVGVYAWRALSGTARLERLYGELSSKRGTMAAVLQENIAGMRVVQSFGAGDHEQDKFKGEAAGVADRSLAVKGFWIKRTALFRFLSTATIGLIVWQGGHEVVGGTLTPGELTVFMLYLGMLESRVTKLIDFSLYLIQNVPSGKRVLEVLDAESPVREKPVAKSLDEVRGHVKFEGVSMSYDSSGEAVQDIDLEVRPGQLVAMLGPPGSGKTTIAHLIPRFYDVTDGRVTIDGLDVRDVSLASLRGNVGIALQDVFVFGAPFRDNIKFGAAGMTDDDMVRAAKIAQLHQFIESLPDGYDTWVGERGVKLSGGQRQRLAIARTILVDPPILILDDSTSSVDMATEHEIQKALSEVVKGRTTFVIAHRLSSVRAADLILVMDGGLIVERGTHRELLELGGYYRHIHDMQLAPTVEQAIYQVAGPAAGGEG